MADDRKIKIGRFYYHKYFGKEEIIYVTGEKKGHLQYIMLKDPLSYRWVPYTLVQNAWIEYDND